MIPKNLMLRCRTRVDFVCLCTFQKFILVLIRLFILKNTLSRKALSLSTCLQILNLVESEIIMLCWKCEYLIIIQSWSQTIPRLILLLQRLYCDHVQSSICMFYGWYVLSARITITPCSNWQKWQSYAGCKRGG